MFKKWFLLKFNKWLIICNCDLCLVSILLSHNLDYLYYIIFIFLKYILAISTLSNNLLQVPRQMNGMQK